MPKNNESPQASEDMPKNEGMQENENAQEVVQPKEPRFGESKVSKKYLRFEQLLTEVTFPRGQTEAQTMNQLGKLFATKTGNQKLILDGIRLVKPDYAITAEDEAQRSERRQISKTARDNMFRFVHQTIDLKFDRNQPEGENYDPDKTVSIPRGINLLYNYNLEDGAEAYNQWIQSLFALDEHNQFRNDDINTRTAVMKEFIDRQLETDFDKLYHMTDREVAENFIRIYPLYILLMEGGDALKGWNGKAYNLPADYIDKLFALKATHQGLMGSLKSRFELIASPDYEIFHHERMYINAGGENYNTVGSQEAPDEDDYKDEPEAFEEAQERREISERVEEGKNERAFFDILYAAEFGRCGSGVDMVNQHIRNLGIPAEYLKQIDRSAPGGLTIPLLLDVTDVDGKPVDSFDLTSGVLLTFTDPTNQHKHFLKASSGMIEEIDITRVPDPLKTEPDRLMKMLEAADPWHIRMFTGSSQFNDMKKAMAEVQRLKEELPEEPSSEQQKALDDALEALETSAEIYVSYKGDLTRNTKDSERARINAANSILEFVKDGKALLTAYAEGRALSKIEENEKFTILEASGQYQAEGCNLTAPSTGNYPVTLSYKRNPAQSTGFAYNMDALGQMSQELKKLSAAGKENGRTGAAYTNLDKLTKKLDGFVNGEYKIDYEQMHRVAKDYQALVESAGDDKALSGVLGEHLEQVRGALGAHLHYDNRQLGYPVRWPEPGSEQRGQLEKCLAGLIVEGNIKSVGNENKNWLKYYDTKSINLAKEQIRKGAAFQNMMTKLDETLKKEAEAKVPVTERTGARICQKACGGDFGELLTMYAMELNAVQQKAQPANKMRQSIQNQAPERSNPNQGSIGKR